MTESEDFLVAQLALAFPRKGDPGKPAPDHQEDEIGANAFHLKAF